LDSAINAAARALASGDPLAALDRVALREDPEALALRGIAMAQLGELARARELLQHASRGFADDPRARARCVVAELEVALALRDFRPWPRLEAAIEVLDARGDRPNAMHARLLDARSLLLRGEVDRAEARLREVELEGGPPRLRAMAELCRADVLVRRIRARAAGEALRAAQRAAASAGIVALAQEVERAIAELDKPAAKIVHAGRSSLATLREVEALFAGGALVVDACRRSVGARSLARRPVLLEIARVLAEAWPQPATRDDLVMRVFGIRRASDSLRARLRVEIGRLRVVLDGVAAIEATAEGFALVVPAGDVAVLLPADDDESAAVLALLADGAAWSTSALALALGVSQRSVQRALAPLLEAGRVHAIGRARARRWVLPTASGTATVLLLPSTAPGD
jgi:DNA-binding transcriptional ArsR family regulator